MRNNPYVGPRPYERSDRKNFYGRNREARDLLALILAERVVLFYAPSGAGKTSLLNAEIIPSLEEEAFDVLPKARVGSDLPPDIKNEEVDNIFTFSVLMMISEAKVAPQALCHHTLLSFLQEFHSPQEEEGEALPIILILDQAEELFTTHRGRWREAQAFIEQLNEALEAFPDMGVFFSMREDYIAELDPYAHLILGRFRARFHMEQLNVASALEAVKKPAQQGSCPFDPGVAEKLVDDLRRVKVHRQGQTSDAEEEFVLGPVVEPVQLQVVCHRLWENLPEQADNAIQWEEVEKFGDIDRALIDFYEACLQQTLQCEETSERSLRHWVTGQLITPLQTRGLVLRGDEETGGLPNAAVDVLEETYLIHADVRAGARWYELAHDRMIEPIQQSNRAWEAARQTPLRITAQRWQESKNPGLLYRDDALKEAWKWAKTNPDEVEPYEQEFLEASQHFAQARARVQRIRTAAIITSFVVMTALIFLGWVAGRNGLQAYSRELAAQSRYTRTVSQEQSIRLARAGALPDFGEWWRRSERSLFGKVETTDAQMALRQSLIDFYPSYVLANLGDQVNSIAYSPDGRYLYAAFPDHGVWVLDDRMKITSTIASPSGEPRSAVWSVATSPNGQYLAVSGDDGQAQTGGLVGLWDIEGQQWAATLKVPTEKGLYDEIYTVAFSGDSHYLATGGDYDRAWRDAAGGEDGLVRLWTLEPRMGAPLATTAVLTLTEPQARVLSVAFGQKYEEAPDKEASFVTCPEDMPNCAKEPIETVEPEDVAPPGPGESSPIYLAAGSYDRAIYLWELSQAPRGVKATLVFTLTGHTGAIRAIAFSPLENLLASASDDRTIRLWDTTTGRVLYTFVGHDGEVTTLTFSKDGRYLISGSRDRTVRVWDGAASNPNAAIVLSGPQSVILSLAIGPEGRFLAAGSGDQSVHIWDLDYPRDVGLSTLIGHTDRVRGIAYSPDGKFLAAGDNTGATYLWSMASGDTIKKFPALGGKMWGLAYSPDGQYVATCSEDDKVRIWDVATGVVQAELAGHTGDVEKAAFSKDGKYLVTAADDGKVIVWGTQDWEKVQELTVPGESKSAQAWSVAYSPDGRWIAAGRTKGFAHLWAIEPSGGKEFGATLAATLTGHTHYIMSAAFSPDSRYLVTGSWDNTARIWDTKTYTTVGAPLEHPGYVYSVAFSPDGAYLATGARDGKVRLWALEDFPSQDPKLIATLEGHTDLIWNIAFSPDGRYLASSSWDGTIRRYPVRFEDVLDLSWKYAKEEK